MTLLINLLWAHYKTTDLNKIANKKFNEYMGHWLNFAAQAGIQQVSSCLLSTGAESLSNLWRCWVAHRMQHLDSSLRRLMQQVAAVIVSCHRRRHCPTVGP